MENNNGLKGPVGAGSTQDDDGSAGSNLDILSIAEAHREKSKSQQDLKRQFEEFSRNLSFRRAGSRNKKKLLHHLGELGGSPGLEGSIVESPSEALEDEREDTVGRLTPVSFSAADRSAVAPSGGGGRDVDFPQGFNFKSRPSI